MCSLDIRQRNSGAELGQRTSGEREMIRGEDRVNLEAVSVFSTHSCRDPILIAGQIYISRLPFLHPFLPHFCLATTLPSDLFSPYPTYLLNVDSTALDSTRHSTLDTRPDKTWDCDKKTEGWRRMPMIAGFLLVLFLGVLAAYRYATTRRKDTGLGVIEPLVGSTERGPAQHRPWKPIYHITMGES